MENQEVKNAEVVENQESTGTIKGVIPKLGWMVLGATIAAGTTYIVRKILNKDIDDIELITELSKDM